MTVEQSSRIVELTPAAETAARKYLENEEGRCLRLGVDAGGCSGFAYKVTSDLRKDDDILQEHEGFTVVIDPIAVQFLKNARLDYIDTIGEAGFLFDNPQATNTCGCGTSFDVS